MTFSVITSRKGLFSLKVNGLSMGSVCIPEPAAASVPFSSIFSSALCTACGNQEQGHCLPGRSEAMCEPRTVRGSERERWQPTLPSTAAAWLVPASPGLLLVICPH